MDKNEKRGKFIIECRKKKNISQEDFAKKLNYSRTNISKWETGKSFPSNPDLLEKIAKILDVKIEELINGEKDKTKDKTDSINSILNEYKKEYKKNHRKNILLIISGFITLIITFIMIYFLFIYNQINAYSLSFETEKFKTTNSLLLLTNNVSFLNLNKIDSLTNEKIEKIEIYFYDDNNERKRIYKGENETILIEEDYGYEEYGLNHLSKKDLFIDIITENNQYNEIKINKEKRYTNNNIFPKKTPKIGNDQKVPSSNIKLDILKEYGFTTDNGEDYGKEIDENSFFIISNDNIKFWKNEYFFVTWYDSNEILYSFGNEDEGETFKTSTLKNCEVEKCNTSNDYAEYLNYYKDIILKNQ